MPIRSYRFGLLALGLVVGSVRSAEPDFSDYKTVDQAISAKIGRGGISTNTVVGYLGIYVGR